MADRGLEKLIGGFKGFFAYKLFKATWLHFNTDYDFFKYSGKVEGTLAVFNKRSDKYSFVKLGRLFDQHNMIVNEDSTYFLALCFYHNPKIWVHDVFDLQQMDRFIAWREDQNNREQLLTDQLTPIKDTFKSLIVCEENAYPKLFEMVQGNQINLETLIILDYFMHLTEGWNKNLQNDIIWQTFYKQYLNFRPFIYEYKYFDIDKYKAIIKEILGVI